MRPTLVSTLAMALCGVCAVHAQSWQPPADAQRCPSKWGAGDQRGSGNLMKPQTVLRASRLIRTGEVIELGYVLNARPSTQRVDFSVFKNQDLRGEK